MSRGRFITFEGGEGAGKSTHCRRVAEWLRARGREVVETREPGGSPLAEALRELFLHDWAEGIGADAETLIAFAARAAHVRTTIEPALAADKDVVCDRFVDASYAYQGAGRGVPEATLAGLEQWILRGLRPDVTVLLDIDPQEGLQRTRHRGLQNRFEREKLGFMRRVRDAYLQRAHTAPQRYIVVDANQPVERVQETIRGALDQRL